MVTRAVNPFLQDIPPVTRPAGSLEEASRRTVAGVRRINSQAKGKRAERDLANWWKTHGFPDAHRAVVTGDRFAPDGGDLVLQYGDFRLVIEVKHHDGGLTDGQIAEYGAKLVRQTAQSKGTIGILVERRDRVADPARWWVHIEPSDFVLLIDNETDRLGQPLGAWNALACRTTVGYFAEMLTAVGLTKSEESE